MDKELFSDLTCLNETIINYREIHGNSLSFKVTTFHFMTKWKLELEEQFIIPRGSITDLKHTHVHMFTLLWVNSFPNNWQAIKSRISVNSKTVKGVQTYTTLLQHLMKTKGKNTKTLCPLTLWEGIDCTTQTAAGILTPIWYYTGRMQVCHSKAASNFRAFSLSYIILFLVIETNAKRRSNIPQPHTSN